VNYGAIVRIKQSCRKQGLFCKDALLNPNAVASVATPQTAVASVSLAGAATLVRVRVQVVDLVVKQRGEVKMKKRMV